MSADKMSTVVSSNARRDTIVNLKHVNELPLRNALRIFDQNGDGKIDVSELQKIVYWYGLWKYASIGLCLIVMTLVWATFGLTIWAIDLTKEYTVTDGVLTGGDEVVKMSVASTYIPLSWATLLDRRHLDSLESLSIDVAQSSGKFSAGMYHMKVASYLHANSSYLKLFGEDGSRVWVNSGTVLLLHPDAEEAIMVCGAAACNTLAVDVKPEYLQQLVQNSAALFESHRDFQLPDFVDGVAINKADAQDGTCMAVVDEFGSVDFSQGAGSGYVKNSGVPYAAYRQERVNGRDYLRGEFQKNGFPQRRLQINFNALQKYLKVNPRDNGDWADLAAEHAAEAASNAQEDIEKAIKENSLTRRRLEMHPEMIETVSLNAGDYRGQAKELPSDVAEQTPEVKQEFRKTWDGDFPYRRRLADWDTIYGAVNEGLINPSVTFEQADEADGMEVQDSENQREEVENDWEEFDRRRLAGQDGGYLQKMIAGIQLNPNMKAKRAEAVAGALSKLADEHDYEFAEKINEYIPDRRRLADLTPLDTVNEGFQINLGVTFEQADEADGAEAQNAADEPEHVGTFDDDYRRRRLASELDAKRNLQKMVDRFQVNLHEKAEQAEEVAGALSDTFQHTYAFENEMKKEAMRVADRRRLSGAPAFLSQLVHQGKALEVNPDPVGKPLAGAANTAVKIAEIVEPGFIATTEKFSRRRLQDSSDVELIDSVGWNLNNFGDQASDSSDAVTTDEENGNPDYAGWWDFGRRRLQDLFKAFSTAKLGLNDSGGRTGKDEFKAAYEAAAAEKKHTWEDTSDKNFRRRLDALNKFVDPLNKVTLGLHKDFVQATDTAGSIIKGAAEKANAAAGHFDTGFKRRLQEVEPLLQSERRRLLPGFLNLNDHGYNIMKPQNAALYTPKKAANVQPTLKSNDDAFRVGGDAPARRRLMDDPLVQTVGGVAFGSIRDNGFTKNLKELDQQLGKAVSGLPANVGDYELGFDFDEVDESDRRRLSSVGADAARNLGGTALLSIRDGGFDMITNAAQHMTSEEVAGGPAGLLDYLNAKAGDMVGSRRRLADFDTIFGDFDEVRLGGVGGNNLDTISYDEEEGMTSEAGAGQLGENEELENEITDEQMENRRRLSGASSTVMDFNALNLFSLHGLDDIDDEQDSPTAAAARSLFGDNAVEGEIEVIPADRRRLVNKEALEGFARAVKDSLNAKSIFSLTEEEKNSISAASQFGKNAVNDAIKGYMGEGGDRRRLQTPLATTNAAMGTVAAATTGRADRFGISHHPAFAQAHAAQIAAAGGTAPAAAAMSTMNTVVTSEFPRRRLGVADEIEEKLANTAITSTVDNFNKVSPVLNQFAVQANKAGVPAAAQAANAALNQVVTEFGGRRRLDANDIVKNVVTVDTGLSDMGYAISQEIANDAVSSEINGTGPQGVLKAIGVW